MIHFLYEIFREVQILENNSLGHNAMFEMQNNPASRVTMYEAEIR
jgi:hypothetical protein